MILVMESGGIMLLGTSVRLLQAVMKMTMKKTVNRFTEGPVYIDSDWKHPPWREYPSPGFFRPVYRV